MHPVDAYWGHFSAKSSETSTNGLNRSEAGQQVPVPLGGRDPAQCLIQRSAVSGVRPSLECFRRTDASAPPAESFPTPKIFLQKRLSHKGYPFMGRNHFRTGFWETGNDKILKLKVPPNRGARS